MSNTLGPAEKSTALRADEGVDQPLSVPAKIRGQGTGDRRQKQKLERVLARRNPRLLYQSQGLSLLR